MMILDSDDNARARARACAGIVCETGYGYVCTAYRSIAIRFMGLGRFYSEFVLKRCQRIHNFCSFICQAVYDLMRECGQCARLLCDIVCTEKV